MELYGGVVTVLLTSAPHVLGDYRRILTVRHQWQTELGTGAEDILQRVHAVYEHVARRGTHKQLYSWYAVAVQGFEQTAVVVGGTEEKTVVDV